VLVSALVLAAAAAGCASPRADHQYMPLAVGNRWEYRVTTEAGGESRRELVITERVSPLTCKGTDGGQPVVWSWEDDFLSCQVRGQRVYMLMLPASKGAGWWTVTADGQGVWCRLAGFARVSVPAGTFPSCLEVVMTPRGGSTEMRHWFARGVGWVRFSSGPRGGRPWMVRELTSYRVRDPSAGEVVGARPPAGDAATGGDR
jgi:hypothetical protein